MEVLVCLAGHAGEAISKETLLQTVWPGTFVSDDVLKRCISELRRVFEDDAREPRIIETIPKRGYRLIAPVELVDGTKETSTLSRPVAVHTAMGSRALRWWTGAIAAVILLFVLLVVVKRMRSSSASGVAPIHSLAVLPLQNLSADPSQEYFSDGMTDALITDLAQVGSLKVISRTSSMQYKQTRKSLPEISRELNVDGIVEGTVQHSGDRVRITAQLVDGSSDKHLWANSYEREMRDVFVLEKDIAGDIANHVQARITEKQGWLAPQARPINVDTLEAYLQGNFHLRKGSSPGPRDQEYRRAAEYFQKAINVDPAFVPAYIGMAEAHDTLWWPSSEDYSIMRASAAKALELAPTSSDAHAEMGQAKFEDWDWAGAEEEWRRAIALNPNNAEAHDSLGSVLSTIGQAEEGWKEQEIAQELDPKQDHISSALYDQGQYERYIELVRKAAELHPDDPLNHWFLSEAYAREGLHKEQFRELEKAATMCGYPQMAARLRRAFATSGYTGALQQWAVEQEGFIANKQGYFVGMLAETYTALGDKDRAFYWLKQGCEHRHMAISDPVITDVKTRPEFAPLRSDPRFKDVLRCMGLPP